MKKFMDKDFMLSNETAKKLYHDFAADMPIFDYHCHLSPQMMYEDKPFDNITQIFLGGDHYKLSLIHIWLGAASQKAEYAVKTLVKLELIFKETVTE